MIIYRKYTEYVNVWASELIYEKNIEYVLHIILKNCIIVISNIF